MQLEPITCYVLRFIGIVVEAKKNAPPDKTGAHYRSKRSGRRSQLNFNPFILSNRFIQKFLVELCDTTGQSEKLFAGDLANYFA